MGAARALTARQGLTLDAGALIALDRGHARMLALILQAHAQGLSLHVPAGVVGQAWRNGARQALLARFLRSESVEVLPLDDELARSAGELCGLRGTADVIDASVVLLARANRDAILTSDPAHLRKLDATVPIQRV